MYTKTLPICLFTDSALQKGTQHLLITPSFLLFHILHESAVGYPVTAGCGVVAGKVPVALVMRAGIMQPFYRLINNIYLSRYLFVTKHPGYFSAYLFYCKRLVNSLHK